MESEEKKGSCGAPPQRVSNTSGVPVSGLQGPGGSNLSADHAPPFRSRCLEKPLNRFVYRLPAEAKSGVVDRKHIIPMEPLKHRPRLFRRCVIGDPGVVCPNGQNRQVDSGPATELGEHVRVGGVAGEQDGAPGLLEEIAAVATGPVSDNPRAPVSCL